MTLIIVIINIKMPVVGLSITASYLRYLHQTSIFARMIESNFSLLSEPNSQIYLLITCCLNCPVGFLISIRHCQGIDIIG